MHSVSFQPKSTHTVAPASLKKTITPVQFGLRFRRRGPRQAFIDKASRPVAGLLSMFIKRAPSQDALITQAIKRMEFILQNPITVVSTDNSDRLYRVITFKSGGKEFQMRKFQSNSPDYVYSREGSVEFMLESSNRVKAPMFTIRSSSVNHYLDRILFNGSTNRFFKLSSHYIEDFKLNELDSAQAQQLKDVAKQLQNAVLDAT